MLFCLKNKKENIWNDVVLIYTWYIGRFGDIVGFRFSFRASYRTSVGTGGALRLPTSTPSVGIGASQLGRVLHSPTHNQKLVCLGHECIGLLGEKLDPFDLRGWREHKKLNN